MVKEIILISVGECFVFHFFNVCSGGESFFGTGKDDCSDRGVIVGSFGGVVELVEEGRVEGV